MGAMLQTLGSSTAGGFVGDFQCRYTNCAPSTIPVAYQISFFMKDSKPGDCAEHVLILMDHATRVGMANELPGILGTNWMRQDEKKHHPYELRSDLAQSKWYVYQSWANMAWPSLHALDESIATKIIKHPSIVLDDKLWSALVPVHPYGWECMDPQLTVVGRIMV